MVAAKPSLPRAVPPRAAADNVIATLLLVIPVPMAEVASEVTLVSTPPSVVVEETRGGKLPTTLGGGLHAPSLPSEPKS